MKVGLKKLEELMRMSHLTGNKEQKHKQISGYKEIKLMLETQLKVTPIDCINGYSLQ